MRGTPSLRAKLSGLHRLDVIDPHFAQVHRPHGQAFLVIGFLSSLDVEVFKNEGNELRVGERCVPLVLTLYPSEEL